MMRGMTDDFDNPPPATARHKGDDPGNDRSAKRNGDQTLENTRFDEIIDFAS
jgi:hypothetical protein